MGLVGLVLGVVSAVVGQQTASEAERDRVDLETRGAQLRRELDGLRGVAGRPGPRPASSPGVARPDQPSSSPSSPSDHGSTPPPIASRFYARAFGLVTVGVLGYFLFRVLQPFFTSIIWATLLAFLFQPAYAKLQAKWNRPNLAAATVTAIAAHHHPRAPGPRGLTLFVGQARSCWCALPGRGQRAEAARAAAGARLRAGEGAGEELGAFTSLSPEELIARADEWAQAAVQFLAQASGTLVVGAVNVLTTFAFTMFLLFFFVRDGK